MLESRDDGSKTVAWAACGWGTRAARLGWLAPLVALLLWPASGIADDTADRLRDARRALQQGRYDEALKAFRELERRRADTAAVAIGESQCHDARGEWKPAIELLAAAVKRSPRSVPLWAALARVQFAHGRHDEAGASAAAALALDPDQPLARLVQADLAAATGRLQEADDGYRWFVRFYNRSQPKDPETLLLVAEGAGQYARWNNVTEIFDFVVNELCPDAVKADSLGWQTYLLSGSLLLEKYNRAQALPDLKRALAINPHAAEVHAALGNAEFLRRNLGEAEQDADRALEINPSLVTALRLKAALQLEAGHTRESLEFLRRALEINPRDERTRSRVDT